MMPMVFKIKGTLVHPLLFQIGPLTVYTYGVLVALAFLLGALWVGHRTKSQGENPDLYFQAILWIGIVGFLGARLLHVLYYPEWYFSHPARILFERAGFVWYGGLISGTLTGLLFVRWKHLSLGTFADILVLPACLGVAIGRVGCFFAGCCFGKTTMGPWAVHFPLGHETHPLGVHPTQLYESFALLVLLFFLLRLEKHATKPGVTACAFFMGYGVIRFVIEFFRGDVIYWVGHLLTASQVFSLVGILMGGFILYRLYLPKPCRLANC